MADHAVGVCGFGRCGSTMVMTMLVAGGMKPGGAQEPPYEGDLAELHTRDLSGTAVKLLDSVTYYGIPRADAWRFVWLDRDLTEQARSMVKFVSTFAGELKPDAVERVRASYRRDRPRVMAKYRGAGHVLVLRYEDVLADPHAAAESLRRHVWPALDVAAAAAVVHERDGTCRPDLSVEAAIAGGTS